MAKTPTSEDLYYEKQITETNKYGNALLSEVLAEKISDHKRKLSSRIQIKEEIKFYKKEIEKLRALRIAGVHEILNAKEEIDPTVQIEKAEMLLVKIEKILKDNVCHDASNVIPNEDFEGLKNNLSVLQRLNETVSDVPDTAELKLQKLNEFSQCITTLLAKVDALGNTVTECQNNLIKQTSEAINYM